MSRTNFTDRDPRENIFPGWHLKGWSQSSLEALIEKRARFLLRGLSKIEYFTPQREHMTSDKIFDTVLMEVIEDKNIMWSGSRCTCSERFK